ncbi:MAG: hypothetical protein HDQ88_02250 [Clostridia bacterium]|nr:hypothetical protein [Clostridia bacterium]
MDSTEWRKGLNLDDKSSGYRDVGVGQPYAPPIHINAEKEDYMEKRATLIGIGNCGSQVAYWGEKQYPELFDSIYINTSESDLNQVSTPDNPMKFKIGDPDEVEGSGKNRDKTKEYLQKDIMKLLSNEKFEETIVDKDYCFIIASTAGGTGSGASPVTYKLLKKNYPDTNFVLVFVLPKIDASLMEQGNTLEYLHEVYEVIGDDLVYMVYDNETVADMSPLAGPAKVNEDIIEDIRVLVSVDNMDAKYSNIDMRDMMNIITNPGRLLVARITKGLTEKNLEETRLDDMYIQAIKHSSHAETDRNNKVDRIGFITYLTEPAYKLYPDMEHLYEFLGEAFEKHSHNAENTTGRENLSYAHLIAGGLSPINDRTEKITERVNELKNKMATDDKMKFILEGGVSYNDIMEKRDKAAHLTENEKFTVDDIFGEFK